ncbi:MarR family winged helix-turn-helix transcriptional regulator [Clostridium gasigenes]|uniref:DNA-binding transcriptional regulator, MarR family n=1 Tax=Clostridium gasigenes TaxID=94869 RepID=A0A1H0NP25_9CLOT|nr:MarR family transcriptional regulator [Clostridium gasigenes]MBB6623626.1 MarR family transcriptional regulator [Clostridium gasigenes]MBU3087573.1 MarR family transcriptional regulator [Clostridium gasigenes]MBU3131776.1 MarR family transcriptional regulator [Clostridium gasigenes]NKF05539.1 MarR family transcriptional regulator [Clostridium gasigenes]QSW18981.1 MarR family transcriptional regulator [Clostridium gasigenes]
MVSDKNLILENQLSFIMYACSKETIKRYKSYLKNVDLTYTQYIAMLVLWNGDNITVNELGRKLYLDSGTITPLLKKLESKGLVERARDISDERNVFVRVTPIGQQLKEKVRNIPENILEDTGIPMSEANDILVDLKSVLERVNQK